MSTEMLTCPSCGSPVAANALLCPQCGRPNISTAFAGTYSSPQYETIAPPPVSPDPPGPTGEPEQAMSAPEHDTPAAEATVIKPVPAPEVPGAPIPTPPARRQQPPEPTGPSMGDIFTGVPTYRPELPANLRPGTLYAGPNMTIRELEQSLAASRPAPQAHTLMVGGELPRQARLPGEPGTPQAQPGQEEQTLHVRPRAPYDVDQPSQPQANYGAWSRRASRRQGGQNTLRPAGTLAADLFRAAILALVCFMGLTLCFAATNLGGIAWLFPLVIVYGVLLWWLIIRSRRS